jgi:hypothetical protein
MIKTKQTRLAQNLSRLKQKQTGLVRKLRNIETKKAKLKFLLGTNVEKRHESYLKNARV